MKHYYNFIFFLLILLISDSALAYLDPGTSTLIIQSIIAGIVGFIVTIGVYFHKFIIIINKLFFKKKNK